MPRSEVPTQLKDRDREIYRLHVIEGMTQEEVGREFGGLTRSAVSAICGVVGRFLANELIEDVRELRMRHTLRYEHLYRQSMRAWERSKMPKEVQTEHAYVPEAEASELYSEEEDPAKAMPAAPEVFERTTRTEGQSGNPQHLQTAMEALKRIEDLWEVDRLGGLMPGGAEDVPHKPDAIRTTLLAICTAVHERAGADAGLSGPNGSNGKHPPDSDPSAT